jgi:hypothetical protein
MKEETMALIAFALTCVSVYPIFLFRPRMKASATARARRTRFRSSASSREAIA